MNLARVLFVLSLAAGAAGAQLSFGVVCTTDVPYATAGNNSHKLAARAELTGLPGDTITLVYQSSDGIWSCLGVAGVAHLEWTRPVMLYHGQNPGIDRGLDADRHLVWQARDSISGAWQAYYRNLEYRMAPLLLSESRADAAHPDVWGDAAGIAHVVWEDYRHGPPAIYYRACNENGVQSDTFRVSSSGNCFRPAIQHFSEDSALVVVWQRVDTASGQPYSIRRRSRRNGVWQSESIVAQSSSPMRHSSLDHGSPGEGFACAWEDSSSGNMEVRFIGGNGGGYTTPGRSTVPVGSHLGSTWSYLFWQEETAPGVFDICRHYYYFMTGWHGARLRQELPITENVRNPSCLGATVVWTQGDGPQYKVMYGHYGYPIGITEDRRRTTASRLSVKPNPFRATTAIRLSSDSPTTEPLSLTPELHVFDATGRSVRTLLLDRNGSAVWAGTDDAGRTVPSGVYVVKAGDAAARVTKQ